MRVGGAREEGEERQCRRVREEHCIFFLCALLFPIYTQCLKSPGPQEIRTRNRSRKSHSPLQPTSPQQHTYRKPNPSHSRALRLAAQNFPRASFRQTRTGAWKSSRKEQQPAQSVQRGCTSPARVLSKRQLDHPTWTQRAQRAVHVAWPRPQKGSGPRSR